MAQIDSIRDTMIAVDAMGGDRAPDAIVRGAVAAAKDGIPVLLCGNQDSILSILDAHYPEWQLLPVQIQHTSQEISMEDEPTKAVKKKPDSSLVGAIKAVQAGRAAAMVSAGNSGAVLVASVLYSGRVPGVQRPAVGSFIPTRTKSTFCLDLGANVDCRASYLYQFALMGHAYMRVVAGIEKPRVALLSNGHEPYKGSAEVKKAYDLLFSAPIEFVGNMEPREMFNDGADVLVCDGFAGNVLLKTVQGAAQLLFSWIKDETEKASWWEQGMLLGATPLLKRIKAKTDYAVTGGALLLGVKHPIILAHGRSDARAIANAIRFAHQVVEKNYVGRFNDELALLITKQATFAGAVTQKVRSIFHWGQP